MIHLLYDQYTDEVRVFRYLFDALEFIKDEEDQERFRLVENLEVIE